MTIASSTGTTLFTILQNGNVGIGTSTPNAKLEITTTDLIGMQINTSNTSNSTYPLNFNRSATNVQKEVEKGGPDLDDEPADEYSFYSGLICPPRTHNRGTVPLRPHSDDNAK